MGHFCLLKDVESYDPQDWDLVKEDDAREYWLKLFEDHFEVALKHAAERYGRKMERFIEAARKDFQEKIAALREDPASLPSGKLNVVELCRIREESLRDHHLHDPFGHIKERENESSIRMYMNVVRTIHSLDAPQRWLHLVKSVFAGNLFDLGSGVTLHLADKPTDFLAAVDNTRERPWVIDDYDALAGLLEPAPPTPWTKAVVLVDNAGSDFILGVMPLVRELALNGTQICLAANELPSLNDITVDETVEVVKRLSTEDPELAAMIEADMFEVVSTGNDIPLIDLREVTDELNEAAAEADLVIIEGMGRAVESNFDTEFTTDTLRLALLKDEKVAERIGAEVYDCVCKFTPAR